LGRARPPDHLLVLCYHGVSRDWPQPWTVTPEALEAQVRVLISRGWTGTTFLEGLRYPPGTRRFAITFDDAYRSVLELGFPTLRKLGVPATVFVPTDFADAVALMDFGTLGGWIGTEWEEELRCMSWAELRRLHEAGWEIGSHTRSHRRLSELDDDDLKNELGVSKARCEDELDLPFVTLAYPFSDRDPRVVHAARAAGYAAAAADDAQRVLPPPTYEWPRVSVYRADSLSRFRLRTSPAARDFRQRLHRLRVS
jgi:peptidoglycan/xylan/chitin deacetylase (PgdA/CDA1 family)